MGLAWGLEHMGQRNTHRHIIPNNAHLWCESSVVARGQDASVCLCTSHSVILQQDEPPFSPAGEAKWIVKLTCFSFRVACNMMMKKNQNKKHYGTIRTLLLNCVKLLDKSRHPQVRLSCLMSKPLLAF